MGLHSNFNIFMKDWNDTARVISHRKMFFVAQVVFDAFKFVITASPVDTGTFRASHDLTINYPSGLKLIRPAKASRGKRGDEKQRRLDEAQARLDGISATAFAEADRVDIFITNNLEYAQVLEDGNSERPGRGIYRKAQLRAERNWNKLVMKGLV